MTPAEILIVEEIGLYDNNQFALMRGNPTANPGHGMTLHACLVGNPLTGSILAVRGNVNADFTNVPACRALVFPLIETASRDPQQNPRLTVAATTVYPGHCWRNGGWAPCQQVHSFVITHRNQDGTPALPWGDDLGYLNGLQLKTRFLAVIQHVELH